jgi:Ca-activated chloride channel family protein
MKNILISAFAAALLLGAMSLVTTATASERSPAGSETIRLRVDLDRGVLRAGRTERAVIKIGLDAMATPRERKRAPVNLALVIDRSGSMSGEKIVQAREAALELVRRMSSEDIVSLVVYDNRVDVLVPAQRVGNGRRLEEAIREISVNGGTALYSGVMQGAAEVRRHLGERGQVNRILLLSDGQANVGPSSPAELARLGSSLVREGISVTTVGLGLGYNEDLMTRLAQASDGNTYFVEQESDLPRIFAAELGDVLNVVARHVTVEIDFPAGVRPLAFVGREGVIRGNRAELSLNQLYGGQEKFALIEVEVEAGSAGLEREIARARVNYEDTATQATVSASAARKVQFSRDEAAVVASADQQVQTDYAVNSLAMAKLAAVDLVDAGRKDEAAAVVRERAKELGRMADAYSNTGVQRVAAAAAPEADRLEREGLDNASRKAYRTENSQIMNQQNSR